MEDLGKYAIIIGEPDFEENLERRLEELLTMDCEEINKMRRRVVAYAKANLVWEKQDNLFIKAIQVA